MHQSALNINLPYQLTIARSGGAWNMCATLMCVSIHIAARYLLFIECNQSRILHIASVVAGEWLALSPFEQLFSEAWQSFAL